MTTEPADKSVSLPPEWVYPPLDAAQIATTNAQLVAVAALRHGDRLTPSQRADLTAAIETQTRHAEALHRVPLRNSDEPAFIRATLGDGR
ncbi:MAG: hypothetical protein HIU92_08230 [Proteobacteria bacterium]|nr:hypothetical protein [Pseudomonadota bacterium]